ncbi:MAG: NAD(P)H-binding protein [Deltaproteobacteria bacterium]|nr:NAD(P)H-binding protein [Deltaproteobacteria bacterium]
MRVGIVGVGYSGLVLARLLHARGDEVIGTTTTPARVPVLESEGIRARAIQRGDDATLRAALEAVDAVVWLSPPSEHVELDATLAVSSFPAKARSFVYGSTTGVYGPVGPDEWVDERARPRDAGPAGLARLQMERNLDESGIPLRVVRIAGIYGPGRTLREGLRSGQLMLFDGGPPRSRVHVEDLARILAAMLAPAAPALALATDELPATTLEVARYTAALLGLPIPEVMGLEDAKRLNPRTAQLRLEGRRCRSLVREALIGPLEYPTYREGVRASLEAEGAL